jgi:hypothetical protein
MWRRMKASWTELKHWPAGQRFTKFYEKQHQQRSAASRLLFPLAAIASLAIGVVLVFIPGPAIVFFALAVALIATQSRWVAKRADAAELALRKLWKRLRHKHTRAHP